MSAPSEYFDAGSEPGVPAGVDARELRLREQTGEAASSIALDLAAAQALAAGKAVPYQRLDPELAAACGVEPGGSLMLTLDAVEQITLRRRPAEVKPEDAPELPPALDLDVYLAAPPPEPDWDWHGLYARADVVIVFGDTGLGKSIVMLAYADAATRQYGAAAAAARQYGAAAAEEAVLAGELVAGRRVAYLDAENPDDVVYERLYALGLRGRREGLAYIHRPPGLDIAKRPGLAVIAGLIARERADVIILDSLRRCAPSLEENDSRAVSTLFTALRELAQQLRCTIIVLHHPSKPVGDRPVAGLHAARGSGDIIQSSDAAFFVRSLRDDLRRIEHVKPRRRKHADLHYRIVADDEGRPLVRWIEVAPEERTQALEPEYLERIHGFVAQHPECSQAAVERGVGGNRDRVRRGLEELAAAGQLRDLRAPSRPEPESSPVGSAGEPGRGSGRHSWIASNHAGSASPEPLRGEPGRDGAPGTPQGYLAHSPALPEREAGARGELEEPPAEGELKASVEEQFFESWDDEQPEPDQPRTAEG